MVLLLLLVFVLLAAVVAFVVMSWSVFCGIWFLESLFNRALATEQRGAISALIPCFSLSMLTPKRSSEDNTATARLGSSTPRQWNNHGRAMASNRANRSGVPHTLTRRPAASNTGPFVQNRIAFFTHAVPIAEALYMTAVMDDISGKAADKTNPTSSHAATSIEPWRRNAVQRHTPGLHSAGLNPYPLSSHCSIRPVTRTAKWAADIMVRRTLDDVRHAPRRRSRRNCTALAATPMTSITGAAINHTYLYKQTTDTVNSKTQRHTIYGISYSTASRDALLTAT